MPGTHVQVRYALQQLALVSPSLSLLALAPLPYSAIPAFIVPSVSSLILSSLSRSAAASSRSCRAVRSWERHKNERRRAWDCACVRAIGRGCGGMRDRSRRSDRRMRKICMPGPLGLSLSLRLSLSLACLGRNNKAVGRPGGGRRRRTQVTAGTASGERRAGAPVDESKFGWLGSTRRRQAAD